MLNLEALGMFPWALKHELIKPSQWRSSDGTAYSALFLQQRTHRWGRRKHARRMLENVSFPKHAWEQWWCLSLTALCASCTQWGMLPQIPHQSVSKSQFEKLMCNLATRLWIENLHLWAWYPSCKCYYWLKRGWLCLGTRTRTLSVKYPRVDENWLYQVSLGFIID